jgi:hypothetical protein
MAVRNDLAGGQDADLEAGGAPRHDDETSSGCVDGKIPKWGLFLAGRGALTCPVVVSSKY